MPWGSYSPCFSAHIVTEEPTLNCWKVTRSKRLWCFSSSLSVTWFKLQGVLFENHLFPVTHFEITDFIFLVLCEARKGDQHHIVFTFKRAYPVTRRIQNCYCSLVEKYVPVLSFHKSRNPFWKQVPCLPSVWSSSNFQAACLWKIHLSVNTYLFKHCIPDIVLHSETTVVRQTRSFLLGVGALMINV